ncbi:MAG: XdhC/CoxI family protein [Planctomycetota bacterium]|nr:MAG: XdhC/CoxI family protein [Planctomycetota bacterium]
MRQILHDLLESHAAGQTIAMTQLVETRGSTPQKAGAAMLVLPDGTQRGTLGGGCVEAEVKRRALTLLAGGSAELLTFQLDSNYGWDDGLICGGRMRMLVDPLVPTDDLSYYQCLQRLMEGGRGCTEAVTMETLADGTPALARWVFDRGGTCIATRGSTGGVPSMVHTGLRPIGQRPRPYVMDAVAYLPHLACGKLLIVGGGHVGQKVGELAADVNFDVTVVDDREEYVSADRFPQAVQRIHGPIDQVLSSLPVDEDTFCIIVTRGHHHDEEALFHLVRRPARYLGMIGSRRKIKMIFDDLRREGIDEALLEKVHAPLGIEIGSQTVPEIAISIVAELIACRNHEAPSSAPTS